jgi:hypothetical protein
MNLRFPSLGPIVALLAYAVAGVCSAADSPAPVTRPVVVSQSVNIDFRGGTIADLVAAISKTGNGYFNIVGEQADLAAPVPAFSLRNADPASLAGALSQLLQPRGLAVVPTGGNPNSAVYVVVRHGVQSRIEPSTFYSAQLTPYLGPQSIDDIIAAIRMAWELDPANDPKGLQLKFHPATSILLLAGPQRAIECALKVISALKRTSDEQPQSAKKPAPPAASENK